MATLDSLAGDQRAVLQLVLGRGRGYAEIARLLSIPPGAVRARALGACDALVPAGGLPEGERRLICDHVLGQLDERGDADARELLARSAPGRAWAGALTAQLQPLATAPLPEIPEPAVAAAAAQPAPSAADPAPSAASAAPPEAVAAPERGGDSPGGQPISRRGGAIVLAVAALLIVAVVLALVLRPHHHSPANLADNPGAGTPATGSAASSTETSTTTSSASAHPVAQINLFPTVRGSKAVAAAEIVQQGSLRAIAIIGQHIPANTKHNSYEVWLYSSPSHFKSLGFVSPAVGRSGRFSDETALPADAAGYRELIVTVETAAKPRAPGEILLRGTIRGLS